MPQLIALKDLIAACGKIGQVVAIYDSPNTARRDFNLDTKEAIYSFIGWGHLEDPTFINVRPWKNDMDKMNPATVYSFSFYSGPKYGYLAFLKSNQTGKWLIKSFKKNTDNDPRAIPSQKQLLELKKKLEGK